jgi:arylsulfatase A-like enzyme
VIRNWRAPAALAPNGRPWNILMLQGDDFVHDIVTAQGMPTFIADYQDDFVVFPNSAAEVPVCFPGRSATLTGKRAIWSGVENNNDGPTYALKAIKHTMFTNLQRKGYKTGFVGKAFNQLGKSGTGGWGTLPFFMPGVDFQRFQWGGIGYFDWDELDDSGTVGVNHGTTDTNTTGTDYAVDVERLRILEFLDATPTNQPWFMYWSTKGCHNGDGGSPIPPSRYAGTSVTITEDDSFGLTIQQSGVPSWLLDEQEKSWNSGDVAAIRNTHTNALRVARALDEAYDVIATEIEARGETQNTIVIVKCDNTIASGEHRLTGKGTPHRSGLNMQLRVKVPGITGGTSYAPVCDIDVAPFIYEMVGAIPDVAPDGMSFLKAMQDLSEPLRDCTLHRSYGNSSPFVSLRFGGNPGSTYYEMDAHDEITEVQPGAWVDSAESLNAGIPAGAPAKLAILKKYVL